MLEHGASLLILALPRPTSLRTGEIAGVNVNQPASLRLDLPVRDKRPKGHDKTKQEIT